MPRVIALGKVQKKLRKKKGEKLDSLGDRDKKRLNTAALREQKLRQMGALRAKNREREMVRCGFFKVATKDATEPLDDEQIRELVNKWIHRLDEDYRRMQAERRPGRPPTSKELLLKQKIDAELEEFRTGYYLPDLKDMDNIENLKRWDGTLGSLAQVKFARISRDGPAAPPAESTEMEM